MPLALVGKLEKLLKRLQGRLREANWAQLPRPGRRLALARTLEDLEGLHALLKKLEKKLSHDLDKEKLGLKEAGELVEKARKVFAQNLRLEEKTPESAFHKVHVDPSSQTELYNSLQERAISVVLQGRYLLERLNLHLAKSRKTVSGHRAAKDLTRLLEAKEEELQCTRADFERLKRKSFMGYMHEENASELEDDLHKLDLGIEKERATLLERERRYAARLLELEEGFKDLRERFEKTDAVHENYRRKASELLMLLKKERDFAKNVLLETEAEVMRLRNEYSLGLITLEEQKEKAREEASEKMNKKLRAMHRELEESRKLAGHFKELARAREREIARLEKKLKKA